MNQHFKALAMNMLQGDLPISHYCWDVVFQGFSSDAVLLKYLRVIFLLLLSLLLGLSRYVDGQTPGVLRSGWYFLWLKQTALEFIVLSASWESGGIFRKQSGLGYSCVKCLPSVFLKLALCWTSEVSMGQGYVPAAPWLLLWVREFWAMVSPLCVSARMMLCVLLSMINLAMWISFHQGCSWWGLSTFLTCQCLKLPHGIWAPLWRCPKLCKAFHLNSYSSSPSF